VQWPVEEYANVKHSHYETPNHLLPWPRSCPTWNHTKHASGVPLREGRTKDLLPSVSILLWVHQHVILLLHLLLEVGRYGMAKMGTIEVAGLVPLPAPQPRQREVVVVCGTMIGFLERMLSFFLAVMCKHIGL
jgi:hypothetical protein